MSDQSTPRVAIVTGGSGGIGRAVSERLARDDVHVVVHFSGNRDKAQQTVDAVTAAGGRATAFGGDVANEQAMAALFDHASVTFGGVDVLVHTAGIMPLAPIAEMDLDTFDRIQRTNVRGTFVVDQLAARQLRPGGPSSTTPHPSPDCRCRPTAPTPPPKAQLKRSP